MNAGGGHCEVVLHVCRVGDVPSFLFCTLVPGTKILDKKPVFSTYSTRIYPVYDIDVKIFIFHLPI